MGAHISIWGELQAVPHELWYVDVALDGHGVRTRVLRAGSGPDLVLLHGTGGHLEAYARNIGPARRALHRHGLRHGRPRLERPARPSVHDRRALRPPRRPPRRARHRARAPVGGVARRLGGRLDGGAPPRPGRRPGPQHPRQHRQQARGDATAHARAPAPRSRTRPTRPCAPGSSGSSTTRAWSPTSWSGCGRPSTPGPASSVPSRTSWCSRTRRSARPSRGTRAGSAGSPPRRCCSGPTTTRPAVSTRPSCCRAGSPGSRLHVIEGAGHWPQWEKPEEFLAAHVEFLGAWRSGRRRRDERGHRLRRHLALAVRHHARAPGPGGPGGAVPRRRRAGRQGGRPTWRPTRSSSSAPTTSTRTSTT